MGDLPMAPPDCEELVSAMRAEGFSAEEYAARFAHTIYCFSLGDYRYRDSASDAWIRKLAAILFRQEGAPSLEDLRAKYLTPEERARIERFQHEELEEYEL